MRLGIALAVSVICFASAAATASGTGRGDDAGDFEMTTIERFEEGDAERGERLYLRYCRGCHGEKGRGAAHTFMPHVGNLTKKGYIERLPDGYLYTVIAEGGQAVGKSSYMPAWKTKLSEDDIKNIIAHIRTLPTY
jgi:mono/diheme cytochrome c family protein